MSKPLTIKDLADKLGVVPSTVSAALNGTGRVSDERRAYIRRAAAEFGYYPKTAARLLRSRSTGRIGLLMDGRADLVRRIVSGFGGPIMSHFIEYCADNQTQYDLEFVESTQSQDAGEASFSPPQQFVGGLVDGVLIGGHPGRAVYDWLKANRTVPWVSLDEPAEYEVAHDIDQGARRAMEYLVALGHRRIGYVGGPEKYRTHRSSWESFRQASADFGTGMRESWVRREIGSSVADRDELSQWVASILRAEDRPTAILAAVGGGVITATAMGCGLRVPKDLSVLAYGVAPLTEINWPALTAVEPDYKRMVELAMEMLRRRIAGQSISEPVRYVTPELICRDSTAPLRRLTSS